MAQFSLDSLQDILNKLDDQRHQVILQMDKLSKMTNKYHCKSILSSPLNHYDSDPNTIVEQLRDKYRSHLDFTKQYQLVTITFDPSVSKRLPDLLDQREALNYIIRKFDGNQYFACYEKHKNGILHAHMLIVYDPIELVSVLNKYKSRVTPKRRLHPAINIKAVKQNPGDVVSSYNYIFNHKPDHPEYKDLIINI